MKNRTDVVKMKLCRWIQGLDSNGSDMFSNYFKAISNDNFKFHQLQANSVCTLPERTTLDSMIPTVIMKILIYQQLMKSLL